MRVKRISRLLCALFLLLAMNGCGKEAALESRKTEGPERFSEIRVVAREEGSGIRSSFAEPVGGSCGSCDDCSDPEQQRDYDHSASCQHRTDEGCKEDP